MEVRRSGNFGFVDPGNGSLYSFDISGRGKGWEPSSIMLNHNRNTCFTRKMSVAGYDIVPMGDNNDMPGEVMRLLDRFYAAELDVLTQLTGFHLTRGMLCAMRRPALPEVAVLCANAARVAVLENVMNPTNLGAIFRSAAALGMDAVLLTSAGSDPLYRRAVRVSMGTVFQVPWAYLSEGWTELLHTLGFRTAAMALTDNSISIDNPVLKTEPRLAIVMGTEGEGLSQETIVEADYVVRIPMAHGVDSLNVAAAAAVAFWQLRAPETTEN